MPSKLSISILFSLVFAFSLQAGAQQRTGASNPLDDLRQEIKTKLADAGMPFTEEQEKSITLMTEDRRQASEQLFGETMDFRSGPVQGQQMDRAVAAIDWMRTEFSKRIAEYLTKEQLAVVETQLMASATPVKPTSSGAPAPAKTSQTQFIRINNNNFTAEDSFFRGGMMGGMMGMGGFGGGMGGGGMGGGGMRGMGGGMMGGRYDGGRHGRRTRGHRARWNRQLSRAVFLEFSG